MRLVYFSPLPWASFAQRPHKFVEWFHDRHGADILWVDPYHTRLPAWSDWERLTSGRRASGLATGAAIPEWLTVIKPVALPVEPIGGLAAMNGLFWRRVFGTVSEFLSGGSGIIGIGKPSELALQLLQRYPDVPSFYDAMDDFPAFYGGLSRRAMEGRTNRTASRVSCLLVSSAALLRRFRRHRGKLILIRNACDTDALPPIDSLEQGRDGSVLGYVGTIGCWFDWSMIAALSKAAPSMTVRLVGPIHARPPVTLPDNVELWPACDHVAAVDTMRRFTVGLIPFKCTALTDSVDPIKYYEYRALGLPVLSSRFGEMALRDDVPGVFLVDEHDDIQPKLRNGLDYRYDENEVRRFRGDNSWSVRFDSNWTFSW